MQGTEIELGGFKGRTNKLVDGCYSWWVGGAVGIIEGLLSVETKESAHAAKPSSENEHDDAWDDVDGMFIFVSFRHALTFHKQIHYTTEKRYRNTSSTRVSIQLEV